MPLLFCIFVANDKEFMEFLTLSQLNTLISEELKNAFPETYWIVAETSDVRYNNNGHCYLEFIEKKESTATIIAKARGYIWSSTFQLLKPYFEQQTGQSFISGLKVLVKVSVDFHPLYGYGLNICDIDPAYTLGDMQRVRQQILNQLKKEGVLTLNKELKMPLIPQRLAIISSPTAAGYEDFINHLMNNKQGFVFYPHLFPAVMQGEQTEKSIISALDAIYKNQDLFDVVIIIRGGGATSDLASFDTYALAANCAQFPLPIITGIGHERDDTILDLIANHRAKTPTAVADFLIERLDEVLSELSEWIHYLPIYVNNTIEKQHLSLELIQNNLQKSAQQFIQKEENKLKEKESFFKLSSPDYILSKGYSITLKDGKAVKSTQSLQEGDTIETILSEGKITSSIKFFVLV
jgi:exodeoxyribonuclease VII large subunit